MARASRNVYHPHGDANVHQTVEETLDDLDTSNETKIAGPDPAASTDHAFVRWDGATGRLAQDSRWVVADSGTLVMTSSLSATTAADYLALRPSDYGSNKPAFIITKHATADKWQMGLWDGSDAGGTFDIFSTHLTHNDVAVAEAGRQTIWIPATAMIGRTTNGAASGTAETTTNKIMLRTLNFDTSTQEFAQFQISMPKSWDLGTVTFQPVWSHDATVTNFGVVWALEAVALANDDAADAAFGTAQTSTDTGGTTDDIYVGPESSAITIAGTPAEGDWVVFQIKRVPSDGSDTLAVDARLHGIRLFFTTNARNDA